MAGNFSVVQIFVKDMWEPLALILFPHSHVQSLVDKAAVRALNLHAAYMYTYSTYTCLYTKVFRVEYMVKVYQMYKDIWNTTVNHEASFKIVASGGTFPEGSSTLDRVLDPNKHV